MRAAKKLVAAAGLVLLPALLISAPAHATVSTTYGHTSVCKDLDTGKLEPTGDKKYVKITAPEGKLISGYCVKTDSKRGVEYVKVNPPAESVKISHACKDVVHYSVTYVPAGKPTPSPSPSPSATPPPSETPTTQPTTEPTETQPTTEPTETEPTSPATEPTTEPTETEPTSPATETSPTPSEDVAPATETAPGDDDDSDNGVAGEDETAPTAVDAGLTSSTTPGSTTWMATVAGLGGAVLLAAAAYLMRMRKRGDHRA
ncbi:hypothetical protein KV097_13185 [Mumia sp. zg.B17]|uniref:hypothetical protein n=1 Tax=Mumia sp. zg.B17 TaxID=2855446 RepID=UPI001C6F1108|nr:hypothetical protein [Mumia sp. zg.B17]MBW9206897.1 hypothetical protein [Mumia sp. zg.B17]